MDLCYSKIYRPCFEINRKEASIKDFKREKPDIDILNKYNINDLQYGEIREKINKSIFWRAW